MTRNSRIEWTDHTFNPWVGCTKISPGCDHCYAETWAKRSGMVEWGGPRRLTSDANWQQPFKWNRAARAAGRRDRVFCASLADVFDNEVPQEWRDRLFLLIDMTRGLNWLLLTKRIGNAARMLQETCYRIHPVGGMLAWPHVWIGATVVNQEEADRDIPKLQATPAAVRFLSCEPLLGPIDLAYAANQECKHEQGYMEPDTGAWICRQCEENFEINGIDWVIAGGESGHHARPMHPAWARGLRDQCIAACVPFHFKQWGAWLPSDQAASNRWTAEHDDAFHDWPDGLHSLHLHKKDAGRELDGRTWDQFPAIKQEAAA